MKPTKNTKSGLQVFPVESRAGQSLLVRYKLVASDINEAIQRFVISENQIVGTFIGICPDGIIAAEMRNWHPNLPDAFSKPLILIPWTQALELLERVPDGITGKLLNHRGIQH